MRIRPVQRIRMSRSMPGREHSAGTVDRASASSRLGAASGNSCARAAPAAAATAAASSSAAAMVRIGAKTGVRLFQGIGRGDLNDMHLAKGVGAVSMDRPLLFGTQDRRRHQVELRAGNIHEHGPSNAEREARPVDYGAGPLKIDKGIVRDDRTAARSE